jgi:phage-related protein
MEPKFEVEFLEEAMEFFESLDTKSRNKVIYNINKSRTTNDNELFKKLTDHIWEFRTLYNKTYYRMFAFWDKSENKKVIVFSTHGIIKKTDKTPLNDLEKAERIRNKYFEQKSK